MAGAIIHTRAWKMWCIAWFMAVILYPAAYGRADAPCPDAAADIAGAMVTQEKGPGDHEVNPAPAPAMPHELKSDRKASLPEEADRPYGMSMLDAAGGPVQGERTLFMQLEIQGMEASELEGMSYDTGPAMIIPEYVQPLTGIQRGRNDSNPVWSPMGEMIAFERGIGERKEIIVAGLDGATVQKVYYQISGGEGGDAAFFFPDLLEEVSYNAGISWSPPGDLFVFMSNGGSGNYDLYLCELGTTDVRRLTTDKGKDGHAQWSPKAEQIIFISGRTGKADIFLLDLTQNRTIQLTQGGREYLYPQWSPDGRKIAMLYGSNENHDIYLMEDVTKPAETLKALTTWTYDDLRPVWSPDGTKIAFYSNYNLGNDPKVWCIIVIASDGSDPQGGDELIERVVATDVIPDIERGPAWMPNSRRIVYVRNDRQAYNPIYVVDTEKRASFLVKTDTRMNHDVTCSAGGCIAFRAQADEWDHIYVARLKE